MGERIQKFGPPTWLFAMGEIGDDGEPEVTRSFLRQTDVNCRYIGELDITPLPVRIPPGQQEG